MSPNYYIIFLAALIPLVIGSIWYNPKVFGNVWMRASGLTEEEAASGNMPLIFGLCYVFSVLLAGFLMSFAIHQSAITGLFATQPDFIDGSNQAMHNIVNAVSGDGEFARLHRTFGHGVVHGIFGAVLAALPIISVISLFERRGLKYILVHFGYWAITMALMAGVICEFL